MSISLMTIPAFTREHSISRSLLYRLWTEGRGPRITKVHGRTLISAEAAADWRREMEQATAQRAPTH
jgi:hypothetical protein